MRTMSLMDDRPAPPLRTGDEPLTGGGPAVRLKDFWSWYASDLLEGSIRGPFAEYLVATALGIDGEARMGWQSTDLQIDGGPSVEVKCSSLCTVTQGRKRTPSAFSVQQRAANVYVFAVLESCDPLDVDAWRFCVVPTAVLDREYPENKTLSVRKAEALQPPCRWRELGAAIRSLA